MSLQVPKSTTSIYGGRSLDDTRDSDISILAQGSAGLRPQSIEGDGDEIHPRIPSKTLHRTPKLHSLRARRREPEDSRNSVSFAPATVDHSIREARNEDYHRISIQIEKPLPELPSIDHGDGVVQSRGTGQRAGYDFPFLTDAPIEPCSVGSEEVPSISLFQGSSNFQISNTNINAIGGNATIIQFGDGQFTEIQRNLICDYIANLRTVLPDINNNLKKHALIQSIISLPRAKAVFDDYQNKKKSGPCFKGTREALLREMADWATTSSESRIYILSGLAGIGKSTVAYTIASRAADLNLLGASFFFSRDEADRKNAELFFSTIAYQLCVYNETFAKAIGDVLLTERGSAATTKDPQDQLQALILEPLRSIVQSRSRPILIVVDALDECDEEDAFSILAGLSKLVRDLPSFKIILTTRPQPHLDRFLRSQAGYKIFHLQDIEDRVVDSDIRLYLNHSLSLDAVQERYPQREWHASAEEIDSLVRAAGRLFIIASTSVRYIFDKSASNPAAQMQELLSAFARYHTPFKDLDHFYTVILRNVVPENCGNNGTVSRYQSVVGAIIFVQRPVSVSALAHLVNIDVVEIREVLNNLQSVILLGIDDVPHIYHKSFPDYLMDPMRCKDTRLRINARISHTKIITLCFEIMDKHLKRNILGLGDPARFMSNKDGLRKDGITDEQIQEKIPEQLQYACVYWANHLEMANIEDVALMNGLGRFVHEHMLYWFEVLSLIGKLDSAHHAIGVVLKLPKWTSLDLYQLLSDAIRFISMFYEPIERSALYTYYSALPFTPTDSLLYRQYSKETVHNICAIEGGPERWDSLVANLRHEGQVQAIKFSLNSTLLLSCSEEYVAFDKRVLGKLKIWDAAMGTPISTVPGDKFAVSNDFSIIASSQDNIATLYNVNGSPSGTMFTTSSKIRKLALSTESSRIAAALSDGTVWLWDSRNAELIDRFDRFGGYRPRLQFSPTGTRLAYSSTHGIVRLRDGIHGRSVADLQCGSSHKFEFSGNGSRIASLSPGDNDSLTLWNTESGGLLAAVRNVGQDSLAISANGSLLATADRSKVTLWHGNLAKILVLEVDQPGSMTFSLDNILAIATDSVVKLYNVKTHSFIHTAPLRGKIPLGESPKLALSPDSTRLAVEEYYHGNVNLWDIVGNDASGSPSKKAPVTALALSRDCSRLACGFGDGTVELLETIPTKRRIHPLALRSKMKATFFRIFHQSRHTEWVRALGFNPDGSLFASGSGDGTIKLWNGGDRALRGTLKTSGRLQAVALSNSVLVASWVNGVTLWSLGTLQPIHTFERDVFKVSIAENSTIIALALHSPHNNIELFDVVNCTTIATTLTFDYAFSTIHTMTFLPDNSQVVVQSDDGAFVSFNLSNKSIIKKPTQVKYLIQLQNTPLWHSVPIWHCQDKDSKQHYFAALFSQRKEPVPVLWIPRQVSVKVWTQGSSMIVLGCEDGRVILLRLPISHVS